MNGGTAVIGALRGVLVLDTNDWTPAVNRARGDLSGLRGAFDQLGRSMDDLSRRARNMGAGLSVGLTLPLGALAAASNKSASGFEAAMKRVEAALQGVSGRELKALADQAKELAPRVGKGATEAADGIEALGLAGVSTADILGGALKASLDLAAAGATNLTPAAAMVTDIMGQFKVTAKELPGVVSLVVGALDASKFLFEDFQLALAQGGGVAAAAGLNFRDFASAVAATSAQFSSGSDAGTSFKTYIQALVPISDEAERAMKVLGIEFFDLKTGRMKPLAEQAEVLRKALGGLSDKSKTDALKTIFGSDAARTAIGLMERGRQGILDLQKEIDAGNTGGKIAKRLEGEAAASTRMANAFESLKIAIGEAGLTAMMTAVKNAFASMMESIANANPAILKVGVAFGVVAAAIGPLLAAFGVLAAFILAKLARGFGALGWVVSAIIEPIGTLGAALVQLVANVGIHRGLMIIARGFLGIAGPIGVAAAALLLFKDSVIPALQIVWQTAQATLGPPLEALFTKLGGIVQQVTNGPLGSAFGMLVALMRGVLDVAGTVIAGLIQLYGNALVRALGGAIGALSNTVDVVANMVAAVTALLRGDFAGAWESMGRAVDSAVKAVIDVMDILAPGIGEAAKSAWEAAKAWLVGGFESIIANFTAIVGSGVDWVSSAFPNIVAAAKSVYEGVKGWLVDKFGVLIAWIGNAAKWIGDKYAALKERLGLGGAKADGTSDAPAAPRTGTPPRTGAGRTVSFDAPAKERKGARGRNTKFDAANREQLQLQTELEAARAKGDREREQALQDQLALSRQIEAYQRTGMTMDQARVAASRDMKVLQGARAEAAAKEVAGEQLAASIEVARLDRDQRVVDALERQQELKRRIAFYYEQTKNLAEATRLAEADQLKIDEARARVRARWLEDDTRQRALQLAQARGDSAEKIKALQRDIDIRDRARTLRENDTSLDYAASMSRAATEWDEEDRARMTGNIRATFKDGIRAALDGNFGDFMKNWWRDRIAKGMEEAINSLADLVARLFSNIGKGSGGGGGGILAGIGKALGIVSGAIGGGNLTPVDTSSWGNLNLSSQAFDPGALPAFATGGSFRVGGMSGVDANVVAFRATKGEMVDIRRPGNDNAGGAPAVVQLTVGAGQMFEPTVTAISGNVSVQTMGAEKRRAATRARQRYGAGR